MAYMEYPSKETEQKVVERYYDDAAFYIYGKFHDKYPELTYEMATGIAMYIVLKTKTEQRVILHGGADYEISQLIKNQINIEKSYLNDDEERVYTHLRTTPKEKNKNCIPRVVFFILTGALIIGLAGSKRKTDTNTLVSNDLNKYFAMQNDASYKDNIVIQNSNFVYNAKDGEVRVDVDAGVAQDIADLCNLYPDLIDICMFNAYESYDTDKLYHMDAVLNYLKEMLNKDTSCYEKINTCNVFLEYLIKIRALNTDNSFYEQVDTINIYSGLIKGGIKDPLAILGEGQLKLIDKVLKSYEAHEFNINHEHAKDLDQAIEEVGGGR